MTGRADRPAPTTGPTRRRVLAALGGGALAVPVLAACGGSSAPKSPASGSRPAALRTTVAQWVGTRPSQYQVAHRGSGDVLPEHSMVAYQSALDAGAQAMEVSVDITSDGVLICMHDLTYDRTTTGHGAVAAQPSSVLDTIGIDAPQLGPAWATPPLTPVPRLEQVLDTFGGHIVICLEAKDDNAYEPMMAMVAARNLQASTVVKAYWTSPRIAQAKAAGYAVFAYLGPQDMNAANIAATAGKLSPDTDYLVLPATNGDDLTYYPDTLIRSAVGLGVPVWMYPIHRRADAAHYFGLGAQGMVSASYAYTTGHTTPATADNWSTKRIAAGQICRKPDDPNEAPHWTGTDELTLDRHTGGQEFVTLGQFCPLPGAAGSYTIDFQARWTVLPVDPSSNLTLAFGHADDAYYEHMLGTTNGYHAILRPDGRLQLFQHRAGSRSGLLLGSVSTPHVVAGAWMDFRLQVTPGTLRWARTDAGPQAVITSTDSRYRGGYLHIGRSAFDARVSASVRQFRIS